MTTLTIENRTDLSIHIAMSIVGQAMGNEDETIFRFGVSEYRVYLESGKWVVENKSGE